MESELMHCVQEHGRDWTKLQAAVPNNAITQIKKLTELQVLGAPLTKH